MNEKQADALLEALSSIKSALMYIGLILALSFAFGTCDHTSDKIEKGFDEVARAIRNSESPNCNCSCPNN